MITCRRGSFASAFERSGSRRVPSHSPARAAYRCVRKARSGRFMIQSSRCSKRANAISDRRRQRLDLVRNTNAQEEACGLRTFSLKRSILGSLSPGVSSSMMLRTTPIVIPTPMLRSNAKHERPNKALEPTPTAGTSAAEQPRVPASGVAHL